MFFTSIKEINRLRKETNRLLSKGMSNIYLKVKASFQHAGFSASADFYECANFSAYPHRNSHHNPDC